MSELPRFADMTFEVPTRDGARAQFEAMHAALDAAETFEQRVAAVEAWTNSRNARQTWVSLVDLHFSQDTENHDFKAAREYKDELEPALTDLDVAMKRKLLAHPDRAALESHFGSTAFALWEADAKSFSPEIEPDLVRESKLVAEYTELLASARISFCGEEFTLSTITPHLVSSDRGTRRAADRARWEWFASERERLDRIFDDLVRLRHTMAVKLGYADFVELGYLRMQRVDYDRADVDRLRASIREEIVPLCIHLVQRQEADLGLAPGELRSWDEPVFDPLGNPKPLGDHDWMIARADEMFREMGHGLDAFFRLMLEHDLLDLKSRVRKAPGGFCTSLPTYGVPFVFANFNGTKGDVEVFTHEMGHAFQGYCSRDQILPDYHWPTYESCEIHSMSLEFLTWPWMDKFFGEDAERFRRIHLTQSVLFLAYGTAVDHFQHLVYENPTRSPAERHRMWQEMERAYLPWRVYEDTPHVSDGAFWQRQMHIYQMPFYYIDYVLAQVCALQFWDAAETDRAAAMRRYVALCERGGEASFQALARGAGLVSPFDPGCLSDVVARARDVLG
ncbi:MAG: M3 family oligoendopeptidase [Planctomycetes bacterium]|nr:M3 family oligoendopeptidase [Planctomycetota bacterium]